MSAALLFLAAAAPAPHSDMTTRQTRLLIEAYGECVVKRQERRASEALLANVDNGTLMRNYPQLLDGSCVPVSRGQVVRVKFEGDQYRYALADALVRKELASFPPPTLDSVPQLDHREPSEPNRTDASGRPVSLRKYQKALLDYQQRKAFSVLSLYGECVVRANPAAARALLMADPESPAEAAQFAAIRNSLAACLPEGMTLSFGKLPLRGTIAVNYYRLGKAALGQPRVEAAK